MGRSFMKVSVLACAFGALLVALERTHCRADVLYLVDGRILHGEAIEDSAKHLVFRHEVAGIWTNMTVPRAQIDDLVREDGDQSDLAAKQPAKNPAAPDQQPGQRDTPTEPASNLPKVVVIPLHGSVSSAPGESILNSFDAAVLSQCFEEAEKLKPALVILDIRSPGGLVSEMEAICQTILHWGGRLRIVAFPHDAFSAAAIITLCCKDIVVDPQARIGASVMITSGQGGVSAVDAKMASPHHALQKQFMARSGKPYEVVAAMTIQETELWWSAEKGFSTQLRDDSTGEWSKVDGSTTVLTMTGSDAVKWGLAAGETQSISGVARILGITGKVDIVSLGDSIEKYNRNLNGRMDDLMKQLRSYFTSLGELSVSMKKLRDAYQQQERSDANRIKTEIGRQVTRIQNAGRAIQRIDRSLLARRIKVPDEAIEQMKTDSALLGRINRLLTTDTIDGFNESVERLNAVLESWRRLING